jgi:hypothetical protein
MLPRASGVRIAVAAGLPGKDMQWLPPKAAFLRHEMLLLAPSGR